MEVAAAKLIGAGLAAMALIEAGHADRLLLSSDFASARSLRKNGGAGLAQIEVPDHDARRLEADLLGR